VITLYIPYIFRHLTFYENQNKTANISLIHLFTICLNTFIEQEKILFTRMKEIIIFVFFNRNNFFLTYFSISLKQRYYR